MRRRDFIKGTTAAGSALAVEALGPRWARAQDKSDTLLAVFENGPNSLDFHVPGANRLVYEVVWNIYDRLLSFGTAAQWAFVRRIGQDLGARLRRSRASWRIFPSLRQSHFLGASPIPHRPTETVVKWGSSGWPGARATIRSTPAPSTVRKCRPGRSPSRESSAGLHLAAANSVAANVFSGLSTSLFCSA